MNTISKIVLTQQMLKNTFANTSVRSLTFFQLFDQKVGKKNFRTRNDTKFCWIELEIQLKKHL